MMFSIVLAPDTTEGLFTAIVIVSLFVLMGWALILEFRYINPFTLVKASNHEKWRRATILAFLYTLTIPMIGLATSIPSQSPNQSPSLLIWGGIWIVILPIATWYKRLELERQISGYRYLDKEIKDKNSLYNRAIAARFKLMARFFMTADQRRFLSEGFPDHFDEENGTDPSGQESSSDTEK